MEELQICEVAAKLAQKYVEVGAYHGFKDEDAGFEIAAWYMERMGLLTFGICSGDCDGTDESMRYVNRGETYAVTVILDGEEFWAMSWGDWYEETEREWCEEHDEIRCGYCSHLTPRTPDIDWSEIVCESCGHYVGGGGKPEQGSCYMDEEEER